MSSPFDMAEAAGIRPMSLPTPFAIGPVNAYLIEDEPLTLVDTGPNWATSLDALEAGLAALGRRVQDLELLLITHQHPDHLGLLETLRRRSGAEVAALDTLAAFVTDYDEQDRQHMAFARRLMRDHGVPKDVVTALSLGASHSHDFGSGSVVDRVLADGETVRLRDRTLRVLWRPGHSQFDTLFLDEPHGLLLGGDHLIQGISPNAVVSVPPDGNGRTRSLLRYIESLRSVRELSISMVLPGHGEPIVDHRRHIDAQLEFHLARAGHIRDRLSRLGPASAHEIARDMFGGLALSQAFPSISEVLGHLDLLIEGGAVHEVDGPIARFEPTEPAAAMPA